jgi:hypothetical protein
VLKTTTLERPTKPGLRHEIALEVLGVRLVVRAHGSQAYVVADAVAAAWSRCLVESPEDGGEALYVDVLVDREEEIVRWAAGRGWVAATSLEVLMHNLSPSITGRAIEHLAGQLLMFHACALADPATGATAVFVGPSGMGKTTLSRQLGRSLGYVTDETAAVEADGSVRHFAKPLSVLGPAGYLKAQVSPDELELVRAPATPRLSAIVLLDRRPSAPALPEVSPVEQLEAMAALADQAPYLEVLDRPLQRLAALLEAVGGAQRLSYRDGADPLAVVRTLLHTPPMVTIGDR